jgi:hypothetical protein
MRSRDEVADVVADADGAVQCIAVGLMARSGLRSAEVVDVTPADVDETPSVGSSTAWERRQIPRDTTYGLADGDDQRLRRRS